MPASLPRPEPRPAEDVELVRAAARGDPVAFRTLVERHHRLVYAICRRRTRCPERSMELTQDVFLRVFRSLPEFAERSSFAAWVARIAVNRCLDEWRSAEARVRRGQRPIEEAGALLDPGPHPEGVALGEEHRLKVDRLIGEMPATLREPFLMRRLDGLEYEDIAAALGIGQGAVRMRVCRAREWLAERLVEPGEGP